MVSLEWYRKTHKKYPPQINESDTKRGIYTIMGLYKFFTKKKKQKKVCSNPDTHKRGENLPDLRTNKDTSASEPIPHSLDDCFHSTSQHQLLEYNAGGIEYYMFIATLDITTCPECAKIDMKRFPVSEAKAGVNLPPMHQGCRCTTMPVIDEAVLAKTNRAARDPVTGKGNTVPGNMTYSEWYEKYVKGNAEAEANYKIAQNREADEVQYQLFREVLSKRMPKSLVSFQRIKYKYLDKWNFLLSEFEKYSKLGGIPSQIPKNTDNVVFYDSAEERIIRMVKAKPGILQKDLTEALKESRIYKPASRINSLADEGSLSKSEMDGHIAYTP